MKKIAIAFTGISYQKQYYHFVYQNNHIDFTKSIKNYQKYIFSSANKANLEVSTFISTYDSPKAPLLNAVFKPKKCIFFIVDSVTPHSPAGKNKHVLKVLELISQYQKENNISYDYILLTRFDLILHTPVFSLNIDYSCVNVTSRLEANCLLDDNLVLFPGRYLPNFIQLYASNINTYFHFYQDLILAFAKKINYMIPGNYLVRHIPLFRIQRLTNRPKVYISLGMQCLPALILQELNIKAETLPFDWMISNPKFIYKMLYLLLTQKISIHDLVKHHFLQIYKTNYITCIEKAEQFWEDPNGIYLNDPHYGKSMYNRNYEVLFPHDKNTNDETIDKYIRRFSRLRAILLDTNLYLQLIYISPSSLLGGNLLIDNKKIIKPGDTYGYLFYIHYLLKQYRGIAHNNFEIVIYDSIGDNMLQAGVTTDIEIIPISSQDHFLNIKEEIKQKWRG